MIQQRGASQAQISMFPGQGGPAPLPSPGAGQQPVHLNSAGGKSGQLQMFPTGGAPEHREVQTDAMPSYGARPPDQLKMFMSSNEIHAKYQPLDGDRQESQWEGNTDNQSGKYTQNSEGSWKTRSDWTEPQSYGGYGERESDDELWERKRDESQEGGSVGGQDRGFQYGEGYNSYDDNRPATEYRSVGRTGDYDSQGDWQTGSKTWEAVTRDSDKPGYRAPGENTGTSLYDSIAAGGVRSPVRLGEQFGSMGKKEIVGGHHRLAAQTDIDPNKLMPVLHHQSIREAQGDHNVTKAYPYS